MARELDRPWVVPSNVLSRSSSPLAGIIRSEAVPTHTPVTGDVSRDSDIPPPSPPPNSSAGLEDRPRGERPGSSEGSPGVPSSSRALSATTRASIEGWGDEGRGGGRIKGKGGGGGRCLLKRYEHYSGADNAPHSHPIHLAPTCLVV